MSEEHRASPVDRSLRPGDRLGAYEIDSFLRAGGMGAVYRARDVRLDRTVAIKILPVADLHLRLRFQHEAKVIAALTHPNICTLYDVGQQDGTDYLVMEYLDGQTLADRLAQGALPIDQALICGIEIVSALATAHRAGVIHGDVKPANIMLAKSGAKLLDFGVAKLWPDAAAAVAAHSVAVTQETPVIGHGLIIGTLQYMAPEQLEGRGCDSRADLFGFGAVLYEALTGRKAFDGQSQASVVAAILEREPEPLSKLQPLAPPGLDRLVRKCLAKDREDRWQSAKDLGDELRWTLQSIEHRELTRSEGLPSSIATNESSRKRSRRRFVFRLTIGMSLSALLAVVLVPRWSSRAPSSVLPGYEIAPNVVAVLPAGHSTLTARPAETVIGTAAVPATDAGMTAGAPAPSTDTGVVSGVLPLEVGTRAAAQAALDVEKAIREQRFQEARSVMSRLEQIDNPDPALKQRLLLQIAEGEIRAAVDAYAAAYSSLDRNAVLAVYPAVPSRELSDLDRLRTDFKAYEMRITVKQIRLSQVDGQLNRARVECAIFHHFITFAGMSQAATKNDDLAFERRGGAWVRVR